MHEEPPQKLVLPAGTRIITRNALKNSDGDIIHPKGSVGEITESPVTSSGPYSVRFADGSEIALTRTQISIHKHRHRDAFAEAASYIDKDELFQNVIYRCVVGSRAYGLDVDTSDEDIRGIYLPPADQHWSIFDLPEQITNDDNEECYWELKKFLFLALKGNPNILECLYTPLVMHVTPLARELLDMRDRFVSKYIYQTYNGYAISQFKKMEQDIRNHGTVRWKHAMHLIRLLICGVYALKEGTIRVDVSEYRDKLLPIREGAVPWDDVNTWRLKLHKEFDSAYLITSLQDKPDFDAANIFLIKSRRSMVHRE